MSRRAVIAGIRLLPVAFLLVGVPYLLLTNLSSAGIHSGVTLLTAAAGGAAISATSTLRYYFRPTRLYGPVGMLHSGIALVYLLFLLPAASIMVPAGHSAMIGLDFGRILLLLLLVPAFGLAWAGVAMIQDLKDPAIRLRAEFPAA